MKKRVVLATISILFLSGCLNSHYHYGSSNINKHTKVRISQISIGSISEHLPHQVNPNLTKRKWCRYKTDFCRTSSG